MKLESTCGNCSNLFVGGLPPRMPIAACQPTDKIIPHEWDGDVFTFTRIPSECPRSEGVRKSLKQAPKKEWIIKTLQEIS